MWGSAAPWRDVVNLLGGICQRQDKINVRSEPCLTITLIPLTTARSLKFTGFFSSPHRLIASTTFSLSRVLTPFENHLDDRHDTIASLSLLIAILAAVVLKWTDHIAKTTLIRPIWLDMTDLNPLGMNAEAILDQTERAFPSHP